MVRGVRDREVQEDEEVRKSKCCECKAKFSRSAVPLVCGSCGACCHHQTKCSGLQRGVHPTSWTCSACIQAVAKRERTTSRVVQGEEEDRMGSRTDSTCATCNTTFRRGADPLVCTEWHTMSSTNKVQRDIKSSSTRNMEVWDVSGGSDDSGN